MDLFAQRHRFTFHEGSNETGVYHVAYRDQRAEVSIILEGAIRFVVDGEARHVEAPAISFQAYRERLEVSLPRERRTRTMWCHFSPTDFGDPEWAWMHRLPPALPMMGSLENLFRSATQLVQHDAWSMPQQHDYAAQARDALGSAIFAEYIRCASGGSAASAALPRPVAMVKKAIEERYGEEWDLESLARLGNLNGKYLISLFRKHLGETPISYLWKRRAEAGLALLRQTDLGVEEIAFRCGYQTAAHFSRSIKQRYGRSPRAIRTILPL
ncbi:hypothetical protein CLG96_06265 [Sphingomonas oleivorans]|uniref:HTH araC/xylS-type domain-containing protein n=1 Tax=Sphingomonas oleivorans TaxID=1735121 RepID=A0A2T5FZP2_9SPHN|nr:helix-turn-helix transcriptional regulator [Sphingomonas oleivorans]PTQ12158.1 hypothetical protein CLG96_06265 [Sphingomonas oleivorans]